ncbi:MAG: glycerophosphodiester phosphodiesterase [Acidobacteriota bacterium]|nr:MAG: glycerophosphodiester phosphodiesterase [Acidobacteriota bacterium]
MLKGFFPMIFGGLLLAWATSPSDKVLVAHRGASAYRPEHTLVSYQLAIEQGADFVEQDLQITRDGKLVCLHDSTLERTTNVEEVFPDRFREEVLNGSIHRRWYVSDFTLAEVKQLDAGSWFDVRFAGERVPTFREAIELVKGKAGLYPETKSPEDYREMGLSMEALLVEDLKAFGLDRAEADPSTPVIVQSFSAESLKKLRNELQSDLPLVFLLSNREGAEWTGFEQLRRIAEFASGIGPAKGLIEVDPGLVERAHRAGLTVTPYTFRSSSVSEPYTSVAGEMEHFLYNFGVDAVFTDNPDLFPRNE